MRNRSSSLTVERDKLDELYLEAFSEYRDGIPTDFELKLGALIKLDDDLNRRAHLCELWDVIEQELWVEQQEQPSLREIIGWSLVSFSVWFCAQHVMFYLLARMLER